MNYIFCHKRLFSQDGSFLLFQPCFKAPNLSAFYLYLRMEKMFICIVFHWEHLPNFHQLPFFVLAFISIMDIIRWIYNVIWVKKKKSHWNITKTPLWKYWPYFKILRSSEFVFAILKSILLVHICVHVRISTKI